MIHIKYLDLDKIKTDKKSCKNILYYYIGYVTVKQPSLCNIWLWKSFIPFYQKSKWDIEESNGNKYFTLVATDKSKDAIKRYEELWNKIRYLIWLKANDSDSHHNKYMKIKFNSDDDIHLKKTL